MSRAFLVAGLAYGDEGKGATVSHLCRTNPVDLVVRYNGGPQASHGVEHNGLYHAFSQFGSGSFLPHIRTHLSRFMLVEPFALLNESSHLKVAFNLDAISRTTIDPDCIIITPYHWQANRIKESSRGDRRHGSCGIGVGEARGDSLAGLSLRMRDLSDAAKIESILKEIQDRKLEETRGLWADPLYRSTDLLLDRPRALAEFYWRFSRQVRQANLKEVMKEGKDVVFEGAQGVLLDETHGFSPYNTWTNTTFDNADTLLDEASLHPERKRIGVLRTYFTRHGPGPFVTEDTSLHIPEHHNGKHAWQGIFRMGYFDRLAALYALRCVGGVDALSLTHLDWAKGVGHWPYCVSYDENWDGTWAAEKLSKASAEYYYFHLLPGHPEESLNRLVEDLLGAPVRYYSSHPGTMETTCQKTGSTSIPSLT